MSWQRSQYSKESFGNFHLIHVLDDGSNNVRKLIVDVRLALKRNSEVSGSTNKGYINSENPSVLCFYL